MSKRGDRQLAEVLSSNWFQRRDGDILMSLYYRKVLDVQLIKKLHFDFRTGQIKAYQRLAKLERAGMVKSFWKYDHKFLTLDSAGAYFVAGNLGCNVKDLRWRLNPDQTIQNLEHYLGVNRVGARLADFGDLKMYVTEPNVAFDDQSFRADAIGHLVHEKDLPFYVEYDRDTQSVKVFGETKVANYQNAWKHNVHKEMFSVFPTVLVVTEGDNGRVERLTEQVEKHLEAKILFLVTTMEAFENDPSGKIWTTPNREGYFSLLQAGRKH